MVVVFDPRLVEEKLKKDIATHYLPEYFEAAEQRRTGFWKRFDQINDRVNSALRKLLLEPVVTTMVAACALSLASPIAGLVGLGLWFANTTLQVCSNQLATRTAKKEIQKDIDNGVLPARYNSVLDGRIQNLNQQLEMCTAKKSQLPKPGDVSAAFGGVTNRNRKFRRAR